jgi:hypothetical protein
MVDITDNEGNYKLWRVFINFIQQKPKWFAIYMAAQTFFVFISFVFKIGFFQAIGIALLVDIFWLILFILLPALSAFLMKVILFLLVCGVSYLVWANTGGNSLLGLVLIFFVCAIVVGLIVGLIGLALYCLPGFLLAVLVYQATESYVLSIIVFVIVTIIVVVLVNLISKYILPFLFGYGLNWITLVMATQFTIALIIGGSVYSLLRGGLDFYNEPSVYGAYGLVSTASPLPSLFATLFYVPAPLVIWSFFSGIFCGVLNTPFRAYFMDSGEDRPPLTFGKKTIPVPSVLPVAPAMKIPPPLPVVAVNQPVTPSGKTFCWSCGAQQETKGIYCWNCGAKLDDDK